jgi:hypothetical protein
MSLYTNGVSAIVPKNVIKNNVFQLPILLVDLCIRKSPKPQQIIAPKAKSIPSEIDKSIF